MESIVRIIFIGFGIAATGLHSFQTTAHAEEGFIDQRVRASFPPFSAFLFSSSEIGTVQSNPAFILPRDGSQREYVVGAQLPKTEEGESIKTLITFFLRGRDASFAATPVRKLSSGEIQLTPKEEFDAEALNAEQARVNSEKELLSLGSKLQELRTTAMRAAGVDDLVELQTELNRFQAAEELRQSEEARLRDLIKFGRNSSDPLQVDLLRQNLSESLRETAQVTALADRLKTRKKQAAKEGFQEKLALVKEMSRYSREDLAKEILVLRAKRKELEGQRRDVDSE